MWHHVGVANVGELVLLLHIFAGIEQEKFEGSEKGFHSLYLRKALTSIILCPR